MTRLGKVWQLNLMICSTMMWLSLGMSALDYCIIGENEEMERFWNDLVTFWIEYVMGIYYMRKDLIRWIGNRVRED